MFPEEKVQLVLRTKKFSLCVRVDEDNRTALYILKHFIFTFIYEMMWASELKNHHHRNKIIDL